MEYSIEAKKVVEIYTKKINEYPCIDGVSIVNRNNERGRLNNLRGVMLRNDEWGSLVSFESIVN